MGAQHVEIIYGRYIPYNSQCNTFFYLFSTAQCFSKVLVSDFHHLQGVVGDLIAVRIQDVSVFLSSPP